MNLRREIPLVALGGVLGAGSRKLMESLPILEYQSLLVINLLGAFVLGVLLTRVSSRAMRLFLATGVLGGFTTTSALAVISITNFSNTPLLALLYPIVTLYGGLLLFTLAERLAKHA